MEVGFDLIGMRFLPVVFFLVSLTVSAAALFVVVYFAARLAIRHERKISN